MPGVDLGPVSAEFVGCARGLGPDPVVALVPPVPDDGREVERREACRARLHI